MLLGASDVTEPDRSLSRGPTRHRDRHEAVTTHDRLTRSTQVETLRCGRRDATDKLVLKRLSGPVQVLCGLLAPLVLAQVLASGTLHQRRGQAR